MPNIRKERKDEWAFFLDERGRIAYNKQCRECINKCKQSYRVDIIRCPKYVSRKTKYY